MKKRFNELYESAMSRYQFGGFLASDVVEFAEGALKDRFFSEQPEQIKELAKAFIECGLNLRVKSVKSTFPAVKGAGNPDYNGYSFAIEVVKETAPGRYSQDVLVVPANLLKRKDDGINLPPIPQAFIRQDTTHIKPKEVESETNDVPFLKPESQTKLSDHGAKKNVKGDRELTNKNIKIPAKPAEGQRDPAKYTANYLPKK